MREHDTRHLPQGGGGVVADNNAKSGSLVRSVCILQEGTPFASVYRVVVTARETGSKGTGSTRVGDRFSSPIITII